jgi:hypothetical protein
MCLGGGRLHFVHRSVSGVLSGNSGAVVWEVNLRYNRAIDPSGFAGGGYGAAFVLAASQADFLGGTGYAVVYGGAASPEPFRLVRYSGGLGANANLTDVINSGASGLAAVNNYASLRVVYDSVGNGWSLFTRDDGASAWGTASTLSESNRIGVETADSTYTDTALTHAGFFWSHNTGAAQTVQFDNLRVQAVPEASSVAVPGGALLLAFLVRRRRQQGVAA